ncbi:MAG TPA: 7TM domain-containing protein [Patescibacteria group bacterium]
MLTRLFLFLALSFTLVAHSPQLTQAQTESPAPVATESATSTESATLATPSAEVTQKIQEKKDSDITESGGKQKSILAQYLEENPIEPLTWNNFLQHAIRQAVGEGVPANVIVLVLLFPLIAALIASSRHIIGFRGFGIYIPAVLAVALASTGILEGLIIFLSIIVTALLTKRVLKKTKMSYLPRTGLLIWTVSLGILALLMFAPVLNLVTLMSVNIFPILILVLLSENFLDALSRTKPADAVALTLESLSLAIVSSFILGFEQVQKFALTEPELLLILTVVINIVVAKFAGLRLSEFLRFRSIIEE